MVFNIQRDMDDNDSAGETLKREAKEFFGYFKRGQGVCAYHYVNLPDTKGSVEPEEEDTPHFDVDELTTLNLNYMVTPITPQSTFDLEEFNNDAYEYYETTDDGKTKRLRYAIPKPEDYQLEHLQFLRPRGAHTGFSKWHRPDKHQCGVWLPSFRQGKGTSHTSTSIYMYDPLMEMVERVLTIAGEITDDKDRSLKSIDSDSEQKEDPLPYDLTPVSLLPSIDVLSDALGGLVEWTWYLCEIVITLDNGIDAGAPVFSREERVQVAELVTQAMWTMVMRFAFRDQTKTTDTKGLGVDSAEGSGGGEREVAVLSSKAWLKDLLNNMDPTKKELVRRIHDSVYTLQGEKSNILFDEKPAIYDDKLKLNGEAAPWGICARLRQAVKYTGDALMASVSREFLTNTWQPKRGHTDGMTLKPREPLIPEVDALYREARTYAWTFPDACDYHASDSYTAHTKRTYSQRTWYHNDTSSVQQESSLNVPQTGTQSIPREADSSNKNVDYELPDRMDSMGQFNVTGEYLRTLNKVENEIAVQPGLAKDLCEKIEPGLSPLDKGYIYKYALDEPWVPGKRLIIPYSGNSYTTTYWLPSHYKVILDENKDVPFYKDAPDLNLPVYNSESPRPLLSKRKNPNISIKYPESGVSQEISLEVLEALHLQKTNNATNLIFLPPRRPVFGESMYNFSSLAWMRSMVSISNHKIISKRMELNQTISDVNRRTGFEKFLDLPKGGSPTALNSNSIFVILLFKWFARNGITSDIAMSSKTDNDENVIVNIENNGWHTHYPETWCNEEGEKEDTPIPAIGILMDDYKTEFVRMVLDRLVYHSTEHTVIDNKDHDEFIAYNPNHNKRSIQIDTACLNDKCKIYDTIRKNHLLLSRLRQSKFQLKRSGSSLFLGDQSRVHKDTRDNSIFPNIQTKPNAIDVLKRPLCEFLNAETLTYKTGSDKLYMMFHRLTFYCQHHLTQPPVKDATLEDAVAELTFEDQLSKFQSMHSNKKLTDKERSWREDENKYISNLNLWNHDNNGFGDNIFEHFNFSDKFIHIISVFGTVQEMVDNDTSMWPYVRRVEGVALFTDLSDQHSDVFNYILFNYGEPDGISLFEVIDDSWINKVKKISSSDAGRELKDRQVESEKNHRKLVIEAITIHNSNAAACQFYINEAKQQQKHQSVIPILEQTITMFENAIPDPHPAAGSEIFIFTENTDPAQSEETASDYDTVHFPFCDVVKTLMYSLADAAIMLYYAKAMVDLFTALSNLGKKTPDTIMSVLNIQKERVQIEFFKKYKKKLSQVRSVGFLFVEHKFGLARSKNETDMTSEEETDMTSIFAKEDLDLTQLQLEALSSQQDDHGAPLQIFESHYKQNQQLLIDLLEDTPKTYRRFLKDVLYKKRHPLASDVDMEYLKDMQHYDLQTAVQNKFISPRERLEHIQMEAREYRRQMEEEKESKRVFLLDSSGNDMSPYELERKRQLIENKKKMEALTKGMEPPSINLVSSEQPSREEERVERPYPDLPPDLSPDSPSVVQVSSDQPSYNFSGTSPVSTPSDSPLNTPSQLDEPQSPVADVEHQEQNRKRKAKGLYSGASSTAPVLMDETLEEASKEGGGGAAGGAAGEAAGGAAGGAAQGAGMGVQGGGIKRSKSRRRSVQDMKRVKSTGAASFRPGDTVFGNRPRNTFDSNEGRFPELSYRGQASASNYYYNETSACVGASDDRVEGRLQRMVLDLPSAEHIERTTAMITKLLKEHLVM